MASVALQQAEATQEEYEVLAEAQAVGISDKVPIPSTEKKQLHVRLSSILKHLSNDDDEDVMKIRQLFLQLELKIGAIGFDLQMIPTTVEEAKSALIEILDSDGSPHEKASRIGQLFYPVNNEKLMFSFVELHGVWTCTYDPIAPVAAFLRNKVGGGHGVVFSSQASRKKLAEKQTLVVFLRFLRIHLEN